MISHRLRGSGGSDDPRQQLQFLSHTVRQNISVRVAEIQSKLFQYASDSLDKISLFSLRYLTKTPSLPTN